MNRFDALFQNGSLFMLLLSISLILFFAVYAFVEPAYRYQCFLFVMLGAWGARRHYRRWQQNKTHLSAD